MRVGGSPDDLCGMTCQDVAQALYMISVVMGKQDLGRAPALFIKSLQDGAGLGSIYDCCFAGAGIMSEVGIVIRQAGNGNDLQNHGILPIVG